MRKVNLCISRIIFSMFVVALGFVLMPHMDADAATLDEMQNIAKIFDANYYGTTYPDVYAYYGGDQLGMFNHYVTKGIYENRNPNAYFNATDYMSRYLDLQTAYGTNMPAYASHYARRGMAEGRNGAPGVAASTITAVNNAADVTTQVNTADQSNNLKLVGLYFTEFDENAARGKNIQIAAKNMNGTVVAPGKTFSASNSIGRRTTANGFVEAPVFINKEHAMGIGGGVCQVSSTTYAALKVAGIQASERHPHSLPVAYLPAGWDATISWGSLDMKFVNPFDTNMVVESMTDKGRLIVGLYRM